MNDPLPETAIAGISDLPEIEAIVEAAYRPYVARMGLLPGPMRDDYAAHVAAGRLRVLRDGQGVAGLLVLIPEATHMLLDNIAIAPRAQGRGYGRLLLDCAEAEARRQGFGVIRLYTHVTMVENVAIYRKRGYAETHRAEVNGLQRVYMEKPLP
ncbi:GNAT family N-acetyltransferase [Salipiger bermudensis]|uniref:GNAT family N-acetyltransferase n=1 Tax=Salipiger bermudensis TaxID=344736 RepID=UPI001CD65AA0|nr:GNAT family N-acetyltransferase [Salipiger bermudensis]MCA1286469.1 GNAT family N-acetyltransferase [Salipiger bermudensis]